MARELHDVVAHSVTVISAQAGAAEELLEREPAKACVHLESVREIAHEALVELRRLVGVRREDEPSYAPQPGLASHQELLDEIRATGLSVALEEEGSRVTLPAALDLTAYRIVQECLTDVCRHAGSASARVQIRYGADRLELEITNTRGRVDNAPGPEAHGMIGIRERVRLYGGRLEAGPARDGSMMRLDLAITAGLLVWAILEALLLPGPQPRWARILIAVGFALPLVVRRRAPVPVVAAIGLIAIAGALVLGGLPEARCRFRCSCSRRFPPGCTRAPARWRSADCRSPSSRLSPGRSSIPLHRH